MTKEYRRVPQRGQQEHRGRNLTPKTVVREDLSRSDDFNLGSFGGSANLPSKVQLVLDNSGGATEKSFLLFDPIGLVKQVMGGEYQVPTAKKITATILNSFLASNPVVFSGMRIEVDSSESQFSNDMEIVEASIDGSISRKPVTLDGSVNNDQQNPKIQTFRTELPINVNRAVMWPVNAGEKVIMTLYIKAAFNQI